MEDIGEQQETEEVKQSNSDNLQVNEESQNKDENDDVISKVVNDDNVVNSSENSKDGEYEKGEGEEREGGEGGEGGEGDDEKGEGEEEGEEGEVPKPKKKKKKSSARYASDEDSDEEKIIVIRKIPPARPLPPPPPKIYEVDKSVWATTPISNRVWEVDTEEDQPDDYYTEPEIDWNDVFSTTNFSNEYQFEEGELGSGFFGIVKPIINKKDNQRYAAKIVSHEQTQIVPRNFDSDYEVLQKLSHPNIIKSFAKFNSDTHSLVVLEYFHGKNLSIPGYHPESFAKNVGGKITQALHYLHSNNIVHGDITPENILVTDNGDVKLCGFSCARELTGALENGQLIGATEYQAPEILLRQGYSFKADIWSLGCVLYYLIAGESPFFDNNSIRMQSKVRSGAFEFVNEEQWKNVSSDYKQLISSMLQKDPANRPTSIDIK